MDNENENWVRCFSNSKQKHFYFNKRTREKQWAKPLSCSVKRPRMDSDFAKTELIRAMKIGGSELRRERRSISFDPWTHQIDAVYQLLQTLHRPTRRNYLIQHSTGTGMIDRIMYAAESLINLPQVKV